MTAERSSSGSRIGRMIIIVLAVCVVALALYKFWPNIMSGIDSQKDMTRVPKEIQLTYLPSDYKFNMNEEDAIAILTNPRRYRREFNKMIYDLNMSILDHIGNRMGLTNEQKVLIDQEYEKQHPYLRNLYYEDFMAIRDTTSTLARSWYQDEMGSAVDALHQVASKYTCFLTTQIIANVVPTQAGAYFGKGKKVETPCGIATNEALTPIIARMEESAKIADFSRSQGMLEERVEKAVTELATYEVQSKKGLTKQLATKIWGMNVSSTDIEISAVSVMKLGFKLDDYFNVSLNSRNKVVTITLPEPTILSHSVYPQLDKLDIGWLREVKNVDLNEAFNVLREEFVREARRENFAEDAKAHAQDVMATIMGPVVAAIDPNYKMRVRFQTNSNNSEFEVKDEFTDLSTTSNE